MAISFSLCTEFDWDRVTFFTMAGRGSVLDLWWKMLIIQGCSSCCWAEQGLFCLSPHSISEEAGGAPGVVHRVYRWTPADHRDSQTIWHHAGHMKLGKEGRRDDSEWRHLSSQFTIMHDRALLSWLDTCLPMGSGELILAMLCVHDFCFTYWSVFIWTIWVFSLLFF